MKVSKDAKQGARSLYDCCVGPSGVDSSRVSEVLKQVAQKKPSASAQILHEFHRLIRLEIDKQTARVETARDPDAQTRAGIEASIRSRFGSHVQIQFSVNVDLISGVRIRLGSDVWDANVRDRLHSLEHTLAH